MNVQNSLQAAQPTSKLTTNYVGSVCYPSVNEPTTWSIPNPKCGNAGQIDMRCGKAAGVCG